MSLVGGRGEGKEQAAQRRVYMGSGGSRINSHSLTCTASVSDLCVCLSVAECLGKSFSGEGRHCLHTTCHSCSSLFYPSPSCKS